MPVDELDNDRGDEAAASSETELSSNCGEVILSAKTRTDGNARWRAKTKVNRLK